MQLSHEESVFRASSRGFWRAKSDGMVKRIGCAQGCRAYRLVATVQYSKRRYRKGPSRPAVGVSRFALQRYKARDILGVQRNEGAREGQAASCLHVAVKGCAWREKASEETQCIVSPSDAAM